MFSRKLVAHLLLLTCLAWPISGKGATFISYLLVQGPFGPSFALETQKWEVRYEEGTLTTGQDLLNAVFGVPSGALPTIDSANPTYTTTETFGGGPYDYFKSGNSSQRVNYIDFTANLNTSYENTSLFVESFTLNSINVAMASNYSTGWSYLNAGGTDGATPYDAGTWTIGNVGQQSRTLTNNSFDGWLFGDFSGEVVDGTTSNAPLTGSFAGAQVINLSVPEPGRLILFCLGGVALIWQRRRHCKS